MADELTLKEHIDDHLRELEASIHRRLTALEAMVTAGVVAHQREHAQIDMQKARDETDVNRRLDAMNELRGQINTERGLYVTRPLLDSQLDAARQQIHEVGARLEAVSRQLADLQGRFWMAGTALTFLSVLVNIALHFFAKP